MNQVALITGASRGIGKAIAETFAQAGYHLILTCSRSYESLQAFSQDLTNRYSISCQAFCVDMGNYKEVTDLFSHIPHLDVLVNNAGISYVGLLSEMDPGMWQHIMDVNLNAFFYTSKLSIPLFLQSHTGRIINISSVWGNVGASMEVAYSASKGGVNALTKALAKELAPSNIQVNAIACGMIDTSMNSCFTPEDIEMIRAEIPADRLGTPKEVATLALQLSQSPTYLTGQIITLDGGWC